MYWGANDGARAAVNDPKRRSRRLTTIASVFLLSLGGTVAMAQAATNHPAAGAVRAHTVGSGARLDSAFDAPRPHPIVTTTTTTVPKPHRSGAVHAAGTAPLAEKTAVQTALKTRSTTPAAATLAAGSSCGTALAYLAANSAPGFHFECPGYALGHQAMTCVNVAGVCPGEELIVIHTVCPASYMNEAHNSWIEAGLRSGAIDPYGYCH